MIQPTQDAISIPIHDIKPLVEIQEYSFYYFIALVVIASIILGDILYLLYRYLKHKNRFNLRKEHYRLFKNVDRSHPKQAAYALTKYGLTFRDDDARHAKAYDAMVEKLQKYKYKKDVEMFDKQTQHYIELYEAMLDV
jgi:hypothetical protein